MKGPRVSGFWLGDWGGNANALPRLTFYTYLLSNFLLCGAMFPWKITFAGRVAASELSDRIARRPSRGPKSTRFVIKAHARKKWFK